MDLVSVALATWNGAAYLRPQLDSLLAQTYSNLEIVVCDDCSTDETPRILREYAGNHPNVRTYANERRLGYIANFERAASLCNGALIALCDQDDVWVPSKIEELVAAISTNLLLHSDAKVIDATGSVVHDSLTALQSKQGVPDFRSLVLSNVVSGCTALFRRELLEQARPFPRGLVHDHWLALVASALDLLGYLARPLTLYRQHGANAIGAVRQAAPIESAEDADRYFSESRREYHAGRHARYLAMLEALHGRLQGRKLRFLQGLVEYHGSYARRKVRVRAFLFHLRHLAVLNRGKRPVQVLKHIAASIVGSSPRDRDRP